MKYPTFIKVFDKNIIIIHKRLLVVFIFQKFFFLPLSLSQGLNFLIANNCFQISSFFVLWYLFVLYLYKF